MKIGVVTESLGHLPYTEMPDTAKALGISGVEFNACNWRSAPHFDLAGLLKDSSARKSMLNDLKARNLEVAAPDEVVMGSIDPMYRPGAAPNIASKSTRPLSKASLAVCSRLVVIGHGTKVFQTGVQLVAFGELIDPCCLKDMA